MSGNDERSENPAAVGNAGNQVVGGGGGGGGGMIDLANFIGLFKNGKSLFN